MARRVSECKIKSQRTYTYEEAAEALGVTCQTVRAWRRKGLEVLDGQKPHLILGASLKAFIVETLRKPKRTLAPDQFLCMSCGAPRDAYGGMADYIATGPVKGRLETLCAVCECRCVKIFSKPALPQLAAKLTVAIRSGEQP
ncbi:MAG: hypothetical protein ACPGGK_18230 [Pikeienuella sp.]